MLYVTIYITNNCSKKLKLQKLYKVLCLNKNLVLPANEIQMYVFYLRNSGTQMLELLFLFNVLFFIVL